VADQVDENGFDTRTFCADSLMEVNRRPSASKMVRTLPPFAVHPAVPCSCACALHLASGKRIHLLLCTRHLTRNYAQESRSNICTGRQHRRPPRRGNETALRSRIAFYAKSMAYSMRCWLGGVAALALASVVASPIPPAALQLKGPLDPPPPSPHSP
jgi:hypothetical protein